MDKRNESEGSTMKVGDLVKVSAIGKKTLYMQPYYHSHGIILREVKVKRWCRESGERVFTKTKYFVVKWCNSQPPSKKYNRRYSWYPPEAIAARCLKMLRLPKKSE